MFEKVIQKVVDKMYPGRELEVVRHAKGKTFLVQHDSVGCRDYKLKGTYNYDQVSKLNALTGKNAGFGYTKELGPVAFIGIINTAYANRPGYFKYVVQEFGSKLNDDEVYFEPYSAEEAKKIGNYTVYGFDNPRVLRNAAEFDAIGLYYDYRYLSREYFGYNLDTNNILEMSIKLKGVFSYLEARMFAHGTPNEPVGYSGEDVPIQFAIVNGESYVGIMNLWRHYEDVYFCDVWAKNEEQPDRMTIRFLDENEAKNVKEGFELYYYSPSHSYGKKKYVREKIDRSLEPGFDFVMKDTDGTDYRLQDVRREAL
ncbi:hypothetical protein J6T21_02735 [Candidatus Saccharibacteria bacterium]|nr:hypothetical protein [Candidatus Saccharibacteria bacterium]